MSEQKSEQPQAPDFEPVVKEVPVDAFDRGKKEGNALENQKAEHVQSEKPPKQVDGASDAPNEPRYVHLPGLISDEFGTARSEARMVIATGTVEIDGKPVTLDQSMDLPYDDIVGKTITVKGQSKGFQIDYRG